MYVRGCAVKNVHWCGVARRRQVGRNAIPFMRPAGILNPPAGLHSSSLSPWSLPLTSRVTFRVAPECGCSQVRVGETATGRHPEPNRSSLPL
jgi:hypothetical protein